MRRWTWPFVGALTFVAGIAQACSPTHVDTLQESADKSGLIMIVQIMEVAFHPERERGDPDSLRYAAKFRVVETLKGNPDGVKLLSGGNGGDCGRTLIAGHYVLVTANEAKPMVRVDEFRSSDLLDAPPGATWGRDNARIQALRNYISTGEPIDRCLNWMGVDLPTIEDRTEQEFHRCKSVISSVLKLSTD